MPTKKSQLIFVNAILAFFILVALFMAFKIFVPIFDGVINSFDSETQILVTAIIPFMCFMFILYVVKRFKEGDG